MNKDKSSVQNRIASFKHAIRGIVVAVKRELHLKLHFSAAFLVVLAGLYFGITSSQWLAVVLVIGLVIVSEMMNTVIELFADYLTLERDNRIKDIKDIGAGAVLVSSITAIVVAILIFVPLIIPHK